MKYIIPVIFLVSNCFATDVMLKQSGVRYIFGEIVSDTTTALQADIDALTPSNAFTGLIINGTEYDSAVGGTVTVTQELAQIDGGNVESFSLYKARFNTSVTNTLAEGEVGWNSDDGTLDVGRAGGNATSIGQEMAFRTRNQSGANITNGWVVYQTGFSGNKPLIDVHNGGHAPFGIATETINHNSNGDVATVGYVRGVNTSAYALNAELYASTNGAAITNRPAYPTDAFQVGRVAAVSATEGVILAQTPTCEKSWSELDEQYSRTGNGNYTVSNLTISGTMTFTNTIWDDMTLSSLNLSSGAAAPEIRVYTNGLTTGTGIRSVNYDAGDSSHGQIQFSHKKKRGTDVSPHIHWSTIDDRSAVTNISFRLDAIYGKIMGQLTNTYSSTVTVTGTNAFVHVLTGFDDFGAAVLDESSIVMFEITCVEDGGADNKLFIHDIDFHYQIDKVGSDNEIPNGY